MCAPAPRCHYFDGCHNTNARAETQLYIMPFFAFFAHLGAITPMGAYISNGKSLCEVMFVYLLKITKSRILGAVTRTTTVRRHAERSENQDENKSASIVATVFPTQRSYTELLLWYQRRMACIIYLVEMFSSRRGALKSFATTTWHLTCILS